MVGEATRKERCRLEEGEESSEGPDGELAPRIQLQEGRETPQTPQVNPTREKTCSAIKQRHIQPRRHHDNSSDKEAPVPKVSLQTHAVNSRTSNDLQKPQTRPKLQAYKHLPKERFPHPSQQATREGGGQHRKIAGCYDPNLCSGRRLAYASNSSSPSPIITSQVGGRKPQQGRARPSLSIGSGEMGDR